MVYNSDLQHWCRMFYMFFESRGNKADDPVVLWMSGGPGCSSELALFYENGPFHITKKLTLEWNENGWDKVSAKEKPIFIVYFPFFLLNPKFLTYLVLVIKHHLRRPAYRDWLQLHLR